MFYDTLITLFSVVYCGNFSEPEITDLFSKAFGRNVHVPMFGLSWFLKLCCSVDSTSSSSNGNFRKFCCKNCLKPPISRSFVRPHYPAESLKRFYEFQFCVMRSLYDVSDLLNCTELDFLVCRCRGSNRTAVPLLQC